MSRKKARDTAFKLIFEIPFYQNEFAEKIADFEDKFSKKMEGDEFADFDDLTGNDSDYIKKTVRFCFENLDRIDKKIESALKKWTIIRLPKVSTAILRLSVTEMEIHSDVPYQGAINEAVELAKTYGGDEAASFVNGVLANFIEK